MKRRWWLIAAAMVPVTALVLAAPAAGASQSRQVSARSGAAVLPGTCSRAAAAGLARTLVQCGVLGRGAWLPASGPTTVTPEMTGTVRGIKRASAAIARNGGLIAVSCAGPAACTAVGVYQISASAAGTLAEAWNGTGWHLQSTPNPAGSADSFFTGVSCTAPTACTAVGVANTRAGSLPVAERWNGTAWHIQAAPVPAGAHNADLSGVACTSRSACVAVGGYTARTGQSRELAERWNGTRWSIQAIANPAGSVLKGLSGVSCTSARACTAVGSYVPPRGHLSSTLAERWNGTSWHIQATPNPPMRAAHLRGVSCSTAGVCTATGYAIDSTDTVFPLAEAWNGTRWHIQATPTPSGFAFFAPLSSVSCASPRACTATGSWDNTAGDEFTLAERWNGTRWSIQATPNPAATTARALEGVWCTSPSACTAIGSYVASSGLSKTLAERWNGTRWSIQATPNA